MSASGNGGADPQLRVIIIGAGFSGLGMAIRLRQAGIDNFTVYEARSEIGGTWRDNTYPGCACDIPSHLYSFSFDRKPDWSSRFGPQPEILDYLRDCVQRHGIGPHIRLGEQITTARFDERTGRWFVRTAEGTQDWGHVLVAGTGLLSHPKIPDIAGADRFEGAQFHSATWDHDFDLHGKDVAVIGTGASAIQFVPQIAQQVRRLHLFQRSAPWVIPKLDRPFHRLEHTVFEKVPPVDWAYRQSLYWSREMLALGFVRHPGLLRVVEWVGRLNIRRSIRDPELRAKVTPDYRAGCKRILPSNDYYPALDRDNVEVVTAGIDRLEPGAIVDRRGIRRDIDAVIYGTGFEPSQFLAPLHVIGKDGQTLEQAWKEGAEAYYGMAVAGFPNFFLLGGPNTGLGHNSVVFMAEAQIRYVMQCIELMQQRGLRWVDVLPQRQREFNDELQRRMDRTVWSTGCHSWYLDDRGKNFTLWPGFTFEYWLRLRNVAESDFHLQPATEPPRARPSQAVSSTPT